MKLTGFFLSLHLWAIVDVSLSLDACSKVPDIPHGHVSDGTKKSDYQEGDVIHFSCDAGFIAAQTSKYVCTSQGWLVIRQGTCYSCGTLPDVPHARVSVETRRDQYREEDIIHFTCDQGYSSEFLIKYVCTSDGWLTVRRGSCNSTTCKTAMTHPKLSVTGLPTGGQTMEYGHTLGFECNDDYHLDGASQIRCLQSGEWSAPFPTCTETCKITGVPHNVNHQYVPGNELLKGRNLTFTCQMRSHFIQGHATVQCLDNGQWSHPFPTCGTPVNCMNPPPLVNGDTKETLKLIYSHNETVEFRCQRYHIMEGEPYRTCFNGEWRGDMKCLKPCTVNAVDLNTRNLRFRYVDRSKLYSHHNQEIEFACTRGNPVQTSLMRARCLDGEIRLPSCQ